MPQTALLVPFAFLVQDPPPQQPVSQEPPAPVAQEPAPVLQDPQAPVLQEPAPPEPDAAQVAEALIGGWNVDVHGYLKTSYQWSRDVDVYSSTGSSGVSMDAVRIWVEGEIDKWRVHLGYRGDVGPGYGFFGVVDQTGNLRGIDTTVSRELAEDFWLTVGKFRPPFIASALYEENKLLYYNRTFIGTDWDFYENGVMLYGKLGPFRAWFSGQNGIDNFGEEVALTLRGVWDVFGVGAGQDREGAYGAPEELGMTIGGAMYYDTQTDNASAQAIEARMSWKGFYAGGELVDNGNGLGDLYSWAVMASYLILDDLEFGACLEDFDRDDNTDLLRFSISKYFHDDDAKLQLVWADAHSNAPLADVQPVLLGFTVGF